MSWIKDVIDWYADNRAYATEKFRTPRTVPKYVGAEIATGDFTLDEFGVPRAWYDKLDWQQQQQAALHLSWIFSNITRIGNEVSAADFSVYKKGSHQKDIDHEFEQLLKYPNPFFDGRALLKYTVWALSIDSFGAFWYLTPDKNTGKIVEIWPIMIDRLRPVKDENKFIKFWVYRPRSGRPIKIDNKYICRFFYPNPDDMWRSLPPLQAAGLPISIYEGVSTSQVDIFTKSRGTPLSVLSLDTNISDPDFTIAKQRIREDWEESRKVAVVRAGSLDVKTVGLSNRDLEIISAADFTRDELDAVFMGGIMWRRNSSASEQDEINKQIKEVVIHPLHKQIAAQIQTNIITPFYGSEYIGEFDDIRAQDRSIQLQENQLYWRPQTIDQVLASRGLPPFTWNGYKYEDDEDDETEEKNNGPKPFEDYGSLPYSLATNPSFVLTYYGLGKTKDPEQKPPEIGNLAEMSDPERVVEDLSGHDDEQRDETSTNVDMATPNVDLKAAAVEGVATELGRYKTVMLRTWRKTEDPQELVLRGFETKIIPQEIMDDIKSVLPNVGSEQDIADIFAKWLH